MDIEISDTWFDNENLTSAQAKLLYETEKNELTKIITGLYEVKHRFELPEEKLNEIAKHIERTQMRIEMLEMAYNLKRMDYESQVIDTENKES